jgi:hypothetical protein
MGAMISTVLYQPILLMAAAVLMSIALYYQNESCKSCNNNANPDEWGSDIFKINMGMAIVIIIAAVIINFMSGFLV